MPQTRLNRQLSLGTDGAGFMLYHPADLTHLSPGWVAKDSLIRKEFAAGRLVAFTTSGQGQYSIRITDGPLTAREIKWPVKGPRWSVPSCHFRCAVRHGRLFVENGDCLPGEARESPEARKEQWFEVPNGDYRVTVYGLAWYDEPGGLDANEKRSSESLPDYVICFAPVAELAEIASPKKIPAIW